MVTGDYWHRPPEPLCTDRPMHACLNVDEIIRLVAHELVGSKSKAAAAALACCRKSLEDPVLDALWKTQKELFPLLKCLPGDVWSERGRVSFGRPPTGPEWARFRKYARRMRQLKDFGDCYPPPEVSSVLQFHASNDGNEPLFPNLKTLYLWSDTWGLVPFIPSLIYPRTTVINILFDQLDHPRGTIASMVNTFSTLRPNLQAVDIQLLSRNPIAAAAVSRMLLDSNRDTLRCIHVDFPLTKEAREVIYKLPDLRKLSVAIERNASSPPLVLPNLTKLTVAYDHESDWLQMFSGATFGKLETVSFYSESEQIGDFLETFERAALAVSVQNTLSKFFFSTSSSWRPNYRSLLPFTRLKQLEVDCPCGSSCSSTIDDDIITNIARAMPGLEVLRLGGAPCKTPAGATAKGLMVLAGHCLNLSSLRIHFQVASLGVPLADPGAIPGDGPTALRRDCALTTLSVGEIAMPEEAIPMVAQNLSRIFPHLDFIDPELDEEFCGVLDEGWEMVIVMICVSRKQTAGHLGPTAEELDDAYI